MVYDSDPGVCDRINTRTNVMFQILPSTNEQKIGHQHSLSYVRMIIVYDISYRVDRPLQYCDHMKWEFPEGMRRTLWSSSWEGREVCHLPILCFSFVGAFLNCSSWLTYYRHLLNVSVSNSCAVVHVFCNVNQDGGQLQTTYKIFFVKSAALE